MRLYGLEKYKRYERAKKSYRRSYRYYDDDYYGDYNDVLAGGPSLEALMFDIPNTI